MSSNSIQSPSRKRKRTLSQTDFSVEIEQDVLTRSSDIYLEDGNIVLVAENVAFRVHKSQLGRHSDVFRDMLTCVDQPTDAELFDGCPVVRLSDKALETRVLLQALYDNIQFRQKDLRVISVLQMSSKYLVEPLRLSTIETLREVYPDTLSGWEESMEARSFSHSMLTIQLVNADILLPAAYYYLCGVYVADIIQHLPKLPQHVFETYCAGKEQMAIKFAGFIDRQVVGHKAGDYCDRACLDAWKRLEKTTNASHRFSANIKAPRPLRSLLKLLETKRVSNMCRVCCTKLEDAVRKEREDIWESLPETFGLSPWGELRKNI